MSEKMFEVKVDGTDEFYMKLEKFKKQLGISSEKATNMLAQRTALAMMRKIFPQKNSKYYTLRTIKREILRVYIDAGRAHNLVKAKHGKAIAGAFLNRLHSGNLETAKQYLKGTGIVGIGFDGGRLYHSQRVDGKIPKDCDMRVVINQRELRGLIRKQQSHAGKMRAGFFHISSKLGVKRGAHAWIKNHNPQVSSVKKSHVASGYKVDTINHVDYVDRYLTPEGQAWAISNTRKGILRQLQKEVDNLASKL